MLLPATLPVHPRIDCGPRSRQEAPVDAIRRPLLRASIHRQLLIYADTRRRHLPSPCSVPLFTPHTPLTGRRHRPQRLPQQLLRPSHAGLSEAAAQAPLGRPPHTPDHEKIRTREAVRRTRHLHTLPPQLSARHLRSPAPACLVSPYRPPRGTPRPGNRRGRRAARGQAAHGRTDHLRRA